MWISIHEIKLNLSHPVLRSTPHGQIMVLVYINHVYAYIYIYTKHIYMYAYTQKHIYMYPHI